MLQIQKFMIFGLSNILDPWPQWHKELTDGLSSKKSTKASIKHIWNILEYFLKEHANFFECFYL